MWFKVCDSLHSHPKTKICGLEAMGLWVLAASYCGAYGTGGAITMAVIDQLTGDRRRSYRLAKALVTAQLWVSCVGTDGLATWQFHQWAEQNPTAEEDKKRKELRALAGRKGGLSKAANELAKRLAFASHGLHVAKSYPDPDPVPDREENISSDSPPCQVADILSEAERPSKEESVSEVEVTQVRKKLSPADEAHAYFVERYRLWNPRARGLALGTKDRKRIEASLKAGITLDDLKLGCEGLFLSSWHTGGNEAGTQYIGWKYVVDNLETFVAAAAAERDLRTPKTSPEPQSFVQMNDEQRGELEGSIGALFGERFTFGGGS